jgi:hypothetical protein
MYTKYARRTLNGAEYSVQWLAPLFCISEVAGSKLREQTDCCLWLY